MQADRLPDDPRRVKHALKILDDDKNNRHPKRSPKIPPLERRDQHSRDPADHNSDVWDHRENDNEKTNQRRKIQAEQSERATDECSVNETDEQLTAEIRDDVTVNFGNRSRDLIFQRRRPQRQVILPTRFDARSLLQKKEQIDRNHDQAEKKTGDTEEPPNALLENVPNFVAPSRELVLDVNDDLLNVRLN